MTEFVTTWRRALTFDFIVTELEFISINRVLSSHDVSLQCTTNTAVHAIALSLLQTNKQAPDSEDTHQIRRTWLITYAGPSA